ncbi:MAG: flagellar hook capping FlgD N-terminal domain-containing protein [Pirellulales bacterium]
MSQIPSVGTNPTSSSSSDPTADALGGLDMRDFLDLMIAELQNQDPLNPLENSEMLQQIGQMREIGATQGLTETLNAVLLGQNISSASNLIGAEVRALTDTGETASGVVQRITITDGKPNLYLESGAAAEPATGPGALESGTYKYRVVVTGEDGNEQPLAYDVGTATVEGEPDIDQAIQLLNLPETAGLKKIYRTDATGSGDYFLLNTIAGNLTTYVDGAADSQLSSVALTKESGGRLAHRVHTVQLKNVSEIHASAH